MAKDEAAKADNNEEEGVRIRPNLENYTKGRSASGKVTQNCGDLVAETCDGMTVEELAAIAGPMTETTQKEILEGYAHLNYGQQIMCIRNKIRGAVNRADKAHEGDKSVPNGAAQLKEYAAKSVDKRDKRVAKLAAEAEKKAAAKAKEDAKKKKAA